MTTTIIHIHLRCDECQAEFKSLPAYDAHSCYVVQAGGRCEDYPCCGHTDGDGCQTLPEHTKDYWTEYFLNMDAEYYDYE